MEELIRFVVDYEMGIYIILAVVFLINLQRLIRALINRRKATFGLEKEVARKNIRSSITFLSIVALFTISNFILVSFASIRFPGIRQLATPTIDVMVTPESGIFDMEPDSTPEPGLSATQTAIALTGCIPEQLEWISPADGDEVQGSVELIATINVPNMGFYKYEYRYQTDTLWQPINAGNKVIIEDALPGVWNTEQLIPGNYFLRLVWADNANNLQKPCEISVEVLAQ